MKNILKKIAIISMPLVAMTGLNGADAKSTPAVDKTKAKTTLTKAHKTAAHGAPEKPAHSKDKKNNSHAIAETKHRALPVHSAEPVVSKKKPDAHAKQEKPVHPAKEKKVKPLEKAAAKKPVAAKVAEPKAPIITPGSCTADQVAKRVSPILYVTNMETGEVIAGAESADKHFFQASATKMMTIFINLRLMRDKPGYKDTKISIPRVTFKNSQGDIDAHTSLKPNVVSAYPMQLAYVARIRSDNFAAHALAEASVKANGGGKTFDEIAGEIAKELGMTSTYDGGPAYGAGYSSKHALAVQSTTARNETILIAALQREFPEEYAALNAPSVQFEGFDKNGDSVRYRVATKIAAQNDAGYNYYMKDLKIKTGFVCEAGLVGIGSFQEKGINFSFVQAGYKNWTARDKDLMEERKQIEQDIASGKIKSIIPQPEKNPGIVQVASRLSSVFNDTPSHVPAIPDLPLLPLAGVIVVIGLGTLRSKNKDGPKPVPLHEDVEAHIFNRASIMRGLPSDGFCID